MNTRVGDRATEQRETQGRREEWSKRFYEALTYVVDEESPRKRAVGFHLMSALSDSELAGPDELKLMAVFADRVLNPLVQELADAGVDDDADLPKGDAPA